MSVAAVTSAAAAATFAARRFAVWAFLTPKFNFIFFGTFYTSLAQLPVVFNLSFRKFSVLSEDDVEAQAEDTESYKYQSCNKNIHTINKIPSEEDAPPAESISNSVPS